MPTTTPATRTSEDSADFRSRTAGCAADAVRLLPSPVTLKELIQPESIACDVQARSKKHCLEMLSELLARPGHDVASEEVFARLVERERLGSTCLAEGIAFPHCRASGIETERGALIKLSTPIEFDATDGEMVDLVFGLLVPEILDDTHRAVIEHITAVLTAGGFGARLRATKTSGDLYRALEAVRYGESPVPRSLPGG